MAISTIRASVPICNFDTSATSHEPFCRMSVSLTVARTVAVFEILESVRLSELRPARESDPLLERRVAAGAFTHVEDSGNI